MLAKKNRLNLSLDKNSSIFEKGNSILVSSQFFLAFLRPNQVGLKVTCLAPKTAFPQAAVRNFYRRLIYSYVEQTIQKAIFLFDFNFDLVIVLKRKPSPDRGQLKHDFDLFVKKILKQMDLLKN